MSTVKKPQSLYIYVFSIGYVYFVFRDIEKRKRQSPPAPPPPTKSKIARRLDKLRSGQRGIWDDEDNEDDDLEQNVEPKSTTSNKTYIVLSDSDDEKCQHDGHHEVINQERKNHKFVMKLYHQRMIINQYQNVLLA
jgi:hypothetical protein